MSLRKISRKIVAVALATVVASASLAVSAHAMVIDYVIDPEEAVETVTEQEEGAPAPTTFVTTANLNLRSGPSTDYPRLALLPHGTQVTVNFFDPDGWSTVHANGLAGFVYSYFITPHVPGAAPAAPASSSAGTQIHGDVELMHWRYLRNNILPRNTRIHVLDVRTGLTYYVINWSNGNHADVDPATATDTETLRATYGGRWSWDPRPVIVTFNGRSFAAAINGMPHGGSMTAGNGVNGHFCLHFYGSTTHNGNRSYERTMQAAVMEAFNWAR